MEEFNEVSRAQMKIVQPHPGPVEESSQLSEDIYYSGTIGTEKFTLSDTLSHSPDKQSKSQYLFKQGSLGLQQQKSKKQNNEKKFFYQKSQSFMITQEDEISSQQNTPNIRIKSQSNLNENLFNNEEGQEKQIYSLEIKNDNQNKRYKSRNQTGPNFGIGQSELRTHSSSNLQYQNSINNFPHQVQNYHHHHHASSVSTFSFQQLLPNQTGIQKNESQITQSPPARFGATEELGSDIIQLQEDEEDSYSVPYPTYNAQEQNNINNSGINNNQKEQSVIYNQSNKYAGQNTKFQLSLYQADNTGSQSDDQYLYTDNNNNKSSNELNIEETSKSFTKNYVNAHQYNPELSQGTLNMISEHEMKELCPPNKRKRKQNHSQIQVTEGDIGEEEEENVDELDQEEYENNQQKHKDMNQSRKKSIIAGSSVVSGVKSVGRSPQSKITSKASPMNYFSNFKNYISKVSGQESEGPRLKSDIVANSVSQRRDDFSNLHLMNMQRSLQRNEDNQQDKDTTKQRDKSRSIALNVIQTLQKARQKHIERAKADKQAKIMKRVSEFIGKLKIRSKLRTPSLIKKKILDIINDLVYTNRQNIFRVHKRNVSFRLSRALIKFQIPSSNFFYQLYHRISIPLLHPQSFFKLTWDFIHISIIILIFIYIPIQMVTGKNMGTLIEYESEWGNIILMILFFFIMDIIISFNTGIYDQGIVNENRKDIAITYIKGQMILDILFSICIMKTYYDIESEYVFSIICSFILFFKILKLRRIVNNFTDILLSIRNNTKLYYLVELMSLLGTILFVGHIFGCAFWKVAEQNNETSKNWLKKINIQDDLWQIKYLYAIYYSITTMITVGYGDITPQNSSEIIMIIVYMILSSAIFGYSLNKIGGIIKEIQKDGHYIKEQMSLVNRYLNDKNISRDLKVTIRMFLQYKLKTKNIISLEQEKYIQDELSTHLREKLIQEENINMMRQCKSTFSNFSEKCLSKLALRVKIIRVSKNEMIFEEEQLDDDPLFYYIQRGSIELFVESVKGDYNFTTLAILSEGNSLGEPSIYLDQAKTVSAKAMEMSILRTLSRSDILDVLRFFPKDYEKFCFFRDEILFNKQTDQIYQSCYNCQSLHHTINQCPSLHYIPDKEKTILTHIYSEDKKRGVAQRQATRKINAVSNQGTIELQIQSFKHRQKEEMMLLTWGSEENQQNMTSDQEESVNNQSTRISNHTAYTQRQNNYLQQNNNISSISNYKQSNNNLFNKRKANKSGFHPDKTVHHREGEQISRRSRNEVDISSSNSPSTNSSHSSSILSHSFVIFGRDKKSVMQQPQQHQNNRHSLQPQNPMINSNPMQISQVSSNNNHLQQKGLFRMTETVENPIIKEEDEEIKNKSHLRSVQQQYQDESNKITDEIGDERQTKYQSVLFKRTESTIQKNNQMVSTISVTGSAGNDNNNINNLQGFSYNLPPNDRGRQQSMTNTTKSNTKPPQAPSSAIQSRGAQRALSIKGINNNQLQNQIQNQNTINIIDNYQSNIGSTGNLLEVPKVQQRKDSTENGQMNTSLTNRSKQMGENEYNTGRTSYQNTISVPNNQIHQSGNYPLNSGFTFNNPNSQYQNNTVFFNNFENSQLNKQQKIHFDKNQDIPFYNTNEITEESSIMSKQSGINFLRGNSARRNTKNAYKRQSNINQSQQQQNQNPPSIHNVSDDNEQINKNIKLLISLLQEKTPNKNLTPIEGVSNKMGNSPIPRKNTSITQPQSNQSQSYSKQQNFSTFYQNYINQQYNNQILPPISSLQQQLSSQSQNQQDNQVILNGIQPSQFMRRRKPLDDILLNYILQQNEDPHPHQPNIPLIKNINTTLNRDFRTLNSGIHNSGGLIPNNSPINHKQHQKNLVVQRQLDIQFSQKLAKFQTTNDISSNLNNDKKTEKQKYEEFIQKDVLQDQAKEFTFYYPKHNLSQIILNLKTLKVNLCNAFAKYTLYNYKNYHLFPYKVQNTQVDQLKLFQSDQLLI